jgi:hypothetical protein
MLTFVDFVIANIFTQFLVAWYIVCEIVDDEYPPAVWIPSCIIYVAVGALNASVLLAFWHHKEKEQDRLMRSDSYIPERISWLKDATRMLYHDPPPIPGSRMSHVEKVSRRYAAVEDLLRQYCAWEEKNTREATIRDWNSKREMKRKLEFCNLLRVSLEYRKAALLNAAYATSEVPGAADREKATWELSVEYLLVASSIQNFWDEGWQDFIGYDESRKINGTIEKDKLYRVLRRKYI